MDHQIEPEPTEAERQAIVGALEARKDEPEDPRGAWWRAGLREALEDRER